MRRSLHIAKYLFPSHISVYPCPADDTTTKRDNWMKTDEGIDRVKAEALNIVRCVNNGVIPDFEIQDIDQLAVYREYEMETLEVSPFPRQNILVTGFLSKLWTCQAICAI